VLFFALSTTTITRSMLHREINYYDLVHIKVAVALEL